MKADTLGLPLKKKRANTKAFIKKKPNAIYYPFKDKFVYGCYLSAFSEWVCNTTLPHPVVR